jgi:hypothetical protein
MNDAKEERKDVMEKERSTSHHNWGSFVYLPCLAFCLTDLDTHPPIPLSFTYLFILANHAPVFYLQQLWTAAILSSLLTRFLLLPLFAAVGAAVVLSVQLPSYTASGATHLSHF